MSRVAFVIDDEFEDSEYLVPRQRLEEAGHEVTVVGTRAGRKVHGKKGAEARIDQAARDVHPADVDAVVVPGGWSPDHLRLDRHVVDLVSSIALAGKPVAAVCHGPWLLVEAEVVVGKTLTSWPSLRKDLENAGAMWVDREVAEDGNLITSRKPDDLPAFCDALLSALERVATGPASR